MPPDSLEKIAPATLMSLKASVNCDPYTTLTSNGIIASLFAGSKIASTSSFEQLRQTQIILSARANLVNRFIRKCISSLKIQ